MGLELRKEVCGRSQSLLIENFFNGKESLSRWHYRFKWFRFPRFVNIKISLSVSVGQEDYPDFSKVIFNDSVIIENEKFKKDMEMIPQSFIVSTRALVTCQGKILIFS